MSVYILMIIILIPCALIVLVNYLYLSKVLVAIDDSASFLPMEQRAQIDKYLKTIDPGMRPWYYTLLKYSNIVIGVPLLLAIFCLIAFGIVDT